MLASAAGLTQVLANDDYTYLYGLGRIAQQGASGTDYFLGDALGSVRQLVDGDGVVMQARTYDPYGEVMDSAESGERSAPTSMGWGRLILPYRTGQNWGTIWRASLFLRRSYVQELAGTYPH